ncbi:MAG: hypothetical protein AAF517_25875, partial [Planctomycetota bacterium]
MRTFCLVGLLVAVSSVSLAKDEYLYIQRYFDTDGFVSKKGAKDGDFDGGGNAFVRTGFPKSRTVLVPSRRFGSVRFLRPDADGASLNMLTCKGQEIGVRTKRQFNALFVLGSAHHGDPKGEVEFIFEDGTRARSPFGLSDWYDLPIYGEEAAYSFAPIGGNPVDGKCHIWLQYCPIPVKKRVVTIRLPVLPKAKILALSLGSRSTLPKVPTPSKEPLADADVLVFSEPGFPYAEAIGIATPEQILAMFEARGMKAATVSRDQLRGESLSPKSHPLIVFPYGGTFPFESLAALRRYRAAGGIFVHVGAPFRRRCAPSPYGPWRFHRFHAADNAWTKEFVTPSHKNYIGSMPLS